MNEMGGKFARS